MCANSSDSCNAYPQQSFWGNTEGPVLLHFVGIWHRLQYTESFLYPLYPSQTKAGGGPFTVPYRTLSLRAVIHWCVYQFCPSQGKVEGPPNSHPLEGPYAESSHLIKLWLMIYGKLRNEIPLPGSLRNNRLYKIFPAPMLGKFISSGTPLFLWLRQL